MKKFALGSIALLALVFGTYSIPSSVSSAVAFAQTTTGTTPKRPIAQPAFIPPPSCPMNDPNGCGIYD